MRRFLLTSVVLMTSVILFAQYDWDGIDVPAEKGNSTVIWELDEDLSDGFNYEAPYGSSKGTVFNAKWADGYINSWPGFGNTIWTPDNSRVTGGNLELKATVNPNKIGHNYFSAVHARKTIVYPAYIETRMKVMNSVMANAVWMLSSNSAEEIDIVEAYGSSYSGSDSSSRTWFAQRMHLSHHTFDKSVTPNLDYQPKDAGTYYQLTPAGSFWRNDFHRVGVYWKDPFHLEYYIDGVLVRTVSGSDIIDPNQYLNGNGLTSPESILISGAAQQWMVNGGVYPTVEELAVEEDNIFKVDWIRTYKRKGDYISSAEIYIPKVSDKVAYANPVTNDITVKAESDIAKIEFYNINGVLVKKLFVNSNEGSYSVSDLFKGIYIMRIIDNNGESNFSRIIKD